MNNNPEWFLEGLNPQEFWTEERCYISELLNDPASPEVSIALARVEPGVTTQLHALDGIIERYILRKGQGNVEINGIQHLVKIHDQIIVPTNASQQITNTGDEDIEFYCICTPRFEPHHYINLENN